MTTVAGIDLSLASTGVAVFDGDTIYTHLVKSKGSLKDSLVQRAIRLQAIEDGVMAVILDQGVTSVQPDLVVIEAPSYGSKYGSQHDRSGLWWRVADAILCLDIPLAAVSPNGRAKYATGKGNAGKDEVLSAAIRRYTDADITNNNVADAVVLCAMGVRHLGMTLMDEGLPEKNLEAMAGAEWPT